LGKDRSGKKGRSGYRYYRNLMTPYHISSPNADGENAKHPRALIIQADADVGQRYEAGTGSGLITTMDSTLAAFNQQPVKNQLRMGTSKDHKG